VTSNVKAYAENGKQIAEFDIIVEGRFGTTNMRWLIECRDRPGSGAAPNGWIEQLIGRKQGHVKFDRVTAVSTTGFADGCRELAEPHRIELRTVEHVDPSEFARWIEPGELSHFRRVADLKHVNFEIDWGDGPEEPDRLKELFAQGANAARLWSERLQTHSTCGQAFLALVGQNDVWDHVKEDGEKKSVNLTGEYSADDRFELDLGDRRLPLSRMQFFGDLWIEATKVGISAAERYVRQGENEETIAERVQFPLLVEGHNAVLEFVKLGEDGPTQIQMRIID
jgi:hypothetical protein